LLQELWGTQHALHHVGIVWIYAHLSEGVDACHSAETQMAVQLGQRIVNVLCAVCIVGSCWDVDDVPGGEVGEGLEMPLTMWIVWFDWILYCDSGSSSFITRPE